MSYKFKEIWCNKGNFTESNRKSSEIDTLVIHYTGNNGDTAENNGNYFKNNAVETSAHYFVDDTTVVRSVADKNIAWHAGDWDINCRSIGIEIAGSTTECTGKTLENVIALTKGLMKKYNISKERVIRHYDANGKLCPAFWCGSQQKDRLFREQFWNKLGEKAEENKELKKPTLTYRVYADNKWYDEIKGLSNIAGRKKQAISAVAVKVSKGNIKYRVHLLNGDWLPWVTDYDINDNVNGYAGIKGKVIDGLQVEFEGVGNYKATYRVRKQGQKFFDWQHNTEKDSNQDGYAGLFGAKIDGLQITLT
jgi:N-acetylmuramoyl-L-alanine amidase CwlA